MATIQLDPEMHNVAPSTHIITTLDGPLLTDGLPLAIELQPHSAWIGQSALLCSAMFGLSYMLARAFPSLFIVRVQPTAYQAAVVGTFLCANICLAQAITAREMGMQGAEAQRRADSAIVAHLLSTTSTATAPSE
jgi:hypothetical protein